MAGLSQAVLSCRLADLSSKADTAACKQLLESGGFMSRSARVGWGLNNAFHHPAFQSSDEAGTINLLHGPDSLSNASVLRNFMASLCAEK